MDTRLEHLRSHCVALCSTTIWPEITSEGCILVRDGAGSVYADGVTTHHLVDLLHTLDGHLFADTIRQACRWFADKRSDVADPFFVTTLAQSKCLGPEDRTAVVKAILRQRRKSGLLEIYTAFLDSASLFATLWAVKDLLLLQSDREYDEIVHSGLTAVRRQWGDLHRTSFKGFYLELALASKMPDLLADAEGVCREIIGEQNSNGFWDDSALYSSYLAGNLLSCASNGVVANEALLASDRCLDALLGLNREPTKIPDALHRVSETCVESAYLQTVIRAVIAGVRRLKYADYDVAPDVACALLGAWPTLYRTSGELNARLKKMQRQYGDIERQFQRQQLAAEALLSDGSYERNVFVMMPFRQQEDEQYALLERIVRDELAKKGFRAWLATDRELDPTLWGNITAYMTGCKYGVAIFTRKDDVARGTIEPDFNPNVSLELGFMVSRAKRVLLLKDLALRTLPTDLMGHLYRQFDLRRAGAQLPPLIAGWAEELLAEEKAQSKDDKSGKA